jgi:hypothetical protein
MLPQLLLDSDSRDARSADEYAYLAMAEIALGIFVVGVLFIADPDRLQMVIDQLRELVAWLAE